MANNHPSMDYLYPMVLWDFLIDNLPPLELVLWMAPVSAVYSLSMLYVAGWLKLKRQWKTGYTRKVYHFSIFFVAGAVQVFFSYPGTIAFGCSVSLAIFYGLYRGDGHFLYEGIAREKDAPKRSYYIITPYLATMFGGVLSNFLFPAVIPVFGYLVTGLADAVAEPIGTRFGRHPYKVPAFQGVASYRSLEGSAAVFVASCLALLFGLLLQPSLILDWPLWICVPVIATIATLTEAVSPHGWDNFTLQIMVNLAVFIAL